MTQYCAKASCGAAEWSRKGEKNGVQNSLFSNNSASDFVFVWVKMSYIWVKKMGLGFELGQNSFFSDNSAYFLTFLERHAIVSTHTHTLTHMTLENGV